MPGTGRAEVYFIVAMMLLTFILSGFAMYFFVKTYRKEMREREEERSKKSEVRNQKSEAGNQTVEGGSQKLEI